MRDEFCPQCGTARDGASRSCRQCGLDFEQIDVMAASPQRSPGAAPDDANVLVSRVRPQGWAPGEVIDEIKGTSGRIIAYHEGLVVEKKTGSHPIPWSMVADLVWSTGRLRPPFVVVTLADGSPAPASASALLGSDLAVQIDPFGPQCRKAEETLARLRAQIPSLRPASGAVLATGDRSTGGNTSDARAGAEVGASTPVFCTACGVLQSGAGRFCSSCGHPFDSGAPRVVPTVAGATPAPVQTQPLFEPVTPRIRTTVPSFVVQQLKPGEHVLGAFPASLWDHHRKGEWRRDKFVLTTDRIVSYRTGLVHKEMGEMAYRGITGVQYNRGLRHGKVIIEAANAGLTIDGISNDDAAFCEHVISALVAGRTLAPSR